MSVISPQRMIYLFLLCDALDNSPCKKKNSHRVKINKTEGISSGIISEVSFVLLFQSFEPLWRLAKSDTGESCQTVSHTRTDLRRENSFLHQLVPVHWPKTIVVTRSSYWWKICWKNWHSSCYRFCLIWQESNGVLVAHCNRYNLMTLLACSVVVFKPSFYNSVLLVMKTEVWLKPFLSAFMSLL